MAVVDASVVVKWFVEEEYTDAALAVRDAYVDGAIELAAPSLLPYEVVNALRYSGAFEETELTKVSTALTKYDIDLVPYRRIDGIVETALETDATVYDAAYVTLAETRSEPLYTTDERLLEAVGSYSERSAHVRSFVED